MLVSHYWLDPFDSFDRLLDGALRAADIIASQKAHVYYYPLTVVTLKRA